MMWDTVIGLEVHTQLNTQSKLFSGSSTLFGQPANSQTSYIDAALPGVLPVLNEAAVKLAISFGLAINATINPKSIFERKNYFYPDLPKGYQISQYKEPIVKNGSLLIELPDNSQKIVTIERAHLEEDAGKSCHESHPNYTGIDLNRAGTPLLEIVTTPCLTSDVEAITYLKTLHQLLRFMRYSDANMQEGSFRADVNISLKPLGATTLGTRVELKNLNSFKFIEKAIAYEVERQKTLLEEGKAIRQETRQYNPDKDMTLPLRQKENDNDYRYFPDPDLLPIIVTTADIEKIKTTQPNTPHEIKQKLKNLGLLDDDISYLLADPDSYYFYQSVKIQSNADDKMIVNWLKGAYQAHLNEHQLSFANPPVSANTFAELLNQTTLSTNQLREIFKQLLTSDSTVNDIIKSLGFNESTSANELDEAISALIQNNPSQVAEYRQGKEQLLGFFVGLIMKQFKGKANPSEVNARIKQALA